MRLPHHPLAWSVAMDTLTCSAPAFAQTNKPLVGRPVIRGLEGARVRVLSDGVDVMGASIISPDHAITTDTLLVEQIAVLKAPATPHGRKARSMIRSPIHWA